jgi:hypothetical protein
VEKQRTDAATKANMERVRRMSVAERSAWGLRLFAIYSGQQSAKAYKARGLDSFVHARAAKQAKKRARELAQLEDNTEDKPRSKTLPIG